MTEPYPLKIDAYAHIVPPGYLKQVEKISPSLVNEQIMPEPVLYDLDARFRVMDKWGASRRSTSPSRRRRPSWPAWPTTRWPR